MFMIKAILSQYLQALNLQRRLKFLHRQTHFGDHRAKTPPQLALFAIATPIQPPSILEIRTKNMIFRTKHKLDFTPMACDAKQVVFNLVITHTITSVNDWQSFLFDHIEGKDFVLILYKKKFNIL